MNTKGYVEVDVNINGSHQQQPLIVESLMAGWQICRPSLSPRHYVELLETT